MVDERDSRRREVITSVVSLGAVRGLIYVGPRPVSRSRPACLSAMAEDALRLDADQLVLDRGQENQNHRDRMTLRTVFDKSDMSYLHAASWEHAGLQIADILAWAYGAGGDWRRRIMPIIEQVRRIDP